MLLLLMMLTVMVVVLDIVVANDVDVVFVDDVVAGDVNGADGGDFVVVVATGVGAASTGIYWHRWCCFAVAASLLVYGSSSIGSITATAPESTFTCEKLREKQKKQQ